MIETNSKVVVIVGPTASGKSAVAMKLAKRFNGEIICADSRTIYRDLDIGTAKPTKQEQSEVRHHVLDVVDPGGAFTVSAFKDMAERAIADIVARGKLPIVVGGSGLYIDALIYDYRFPGEADAEKREILNATATDDLVAMLLKINVFAGEIIDIRNRRRVIRAIETAGMERSKASSVGHQFLALGMALNKDVAQSRIRGRVELMLSEGVLEEVQRVADKYGWDSDAFRITGYSAFKQAALKTVTIPEAADAATRETLKLYKRQMTWFKRNPEIRWLDVADKAESEVSLFLRANV